ncbi:MAG: CPBP family glutamic-type intramembrane protease [Coriobacteriia bacterium]
MTTRRIIVNPRYCDRCGRCLEVCHLNALRIGRSYIMVDWQRCDGCMTCARVCERGAITSTASAAAGAARVKATKAPKAAAGASARTAATPREKSRAQAVPATRPGQPRSVTVGHFAWTLLEAVAMLSVTFAAFMAKELVLATETVQSLPAEGMVAARAIVLAGYYAVQLAVLGWLVRRRDGTFGDALGLRGSGDRWTEVLASAGLVLGGLLATRVLATLYGLATRAFGVTPDTSAVTRVFGTTPIGLTLAALMIVLVGPFVEECVFRGALLRGLEARIGAWPAIVVQALLFAAFHRSWWLLVPMTVLGVALGWLAHERRSLWPAIGLHAAYNAITIAAVVLVSR